MSTDQRLPFELDGRIDESLVTGRAGVPLVAELFRASGAAGVLDGAVQTKRRRRGLTVSETAESLFALWSAGGERCEDLARLREDTALACLLGHEIPAPNTVRDFLESFHEEGLPLFQAGDHASVPSESLTLVGLALGSRRLLQWSQERTPEKTATLDVDASVYEACKRSAQTAYEGTRGYQPVIALWAEKDLIVSDEFRDGNVPAGSGNERVIRGAVASLPEGVEERYVRGDSALYEHGVLRYLDGAGIGYAISADMTPELRRVVEAVPESTWRLDQEEADAWREWAEVEFCPADGDTRKVGPVARRYLAIRIRKRQGSLFADGADRRHYAVVTNLDWDGLAILRWHRKKAGTVEHAHDVLKNGLAAGAFPSGKFGANAAWFRLNVILYNLLSALKRETLPGEFWTAKPKRLRFALFNVVGKVVRHARETLLKLCAEPIRALYDRARTAIHAKPPALAGV
jgi:hypothetical protein